MRMRQFQKRKRVRELDVLMLEELKKRLGLGWEEIEILLGISRSQRKRYQSCRRMPASRFYALKDALLIDLERRAHKDRMALLQLFVVDGVDVLDDKQQ